MLDIEKTRKDALNALEKAGDEGALSLFRAKFLSRSGEISKLLKGLKDLPPEERANAGKEANALKEELESEFEKKSEELSRATEGERLKKEWIDITMPAKRARAGHLHPLTKIRREVENVFTSMGFEVAEGPEIDTEHYNFDALNIPADHPAREMWDTFWLDQPAKSGLIARPDLRRKSGLGLKSPRLLLRTHTSPVQVHYMEKHQPPFRIIAPGKVFRYEATDASHDIEFYQVEGLLVSKDASVANFKYLITEFFRAIFGEGANIRLRPSFFPFVEPGFEVDMSCIQCGGKGCSVCKHTGWLEMMGAGMVHPNVFKAAGYNPKLWQGIAFGVGLDRIAIMKYKIPDIRFFHQNDIRFLKQF